MQAKAGGTAHGALLRVVASFVVAFCVVGAFVLVGVNAYFKRPRVTNLEAFRVDPADPALLELLRRQESGEDETAAADAPEPFEWPGSKRAGFVQLEFSVQPDGRATDIRVVGAQPGGYYEDQAAAAVLRRRFSPAYEDGKPVVSTRTEIVDFEFSPSQERR